MELSSKYNPQETETKWLKFWKDHNVFHAQAKAANKPFTIVIPPSNVTGILHMGHALNNTLPDIMVRYKDMNGFEALWMPGTDHAGIATQNVVEKQLAQEGKTRQDLGREQFLKRLWAWKQQYGDTIIQQLEKLGSSCDWPRTRFTMDEAYSDAVMEAFVHLHKKGLIYRGERIINWCPRCQTALSDEEAEHKEKNGKLYFLKYPFKNNPQAFVVVATTRPETMLGDTAVAVNPQDARYQSMIGQSLVLPLVHREIKIIADEFVNPKFGTGAVKVTPAHDPNDFLMGQRHHLPAINVMHPDARINEQGGPYQGLDRFEARKKVLADLDQMGLLEKIEDHKNAVGHCYRCDTIVEPRLSKQWFVKMKPLARPALEAVQKGDIKIFPNYWSKVYSNWMEEIHDWCISRQIWWGHRIPVWYDKEGNSFAAKSQAEAEAQAKQKHGKAVELNQDEDVLDTWFSSWLWPFATLGWPKQNPDLKYFYPTHVLMTASEILFFWVARMIMAGYEFMGEKPFSEVLIHGTVRDAKGRKMSKSLGNAIDPLDIIKEYGADALRFSLIINSAQDIFISKEKFEIGRNFANKIWNASRLILSHVKTMDDAIDMQQLDLPSRWILACYFDTLEKVSKAIEEFKYSEAEIALQDFFWGSFCDWYLELIKDKFQETKIQATALFVLKNSLKMMHPFIPFVTEEIYSKLNTKDQCLSLASWPQADAALIDQKASVHMQAIIDVIGAVRNIRAQWNIKPNETVDAFVVPGEDAAQKLLSAHAADIRRMARLKDLKIEPALPSLKNAATALAGTVKIFVPLSGVIDLAAETKRIKGAIAQKQKSADSLNSRLNDPEFASKAPEDILAKEKERLLLLSKEISSLQNVITNLT